MNFSILKIFPMTSRESSKQFQRLSKKAEHDGNQRGVREQHRVPAATQGKSL